MPFLFSTCFKRSDHETSIVATKVVTTVFNSDDPFLYYLDIQNRANFFDPQLTMVDTALFSLKNACYPFFTEVKDKGTHAYYIFDLTKYKVESTPLEQNYNECFLGCISYAKTTTGGKIAFVERVKDKKTGEHREVTHYGDKAHKRTEYYIKKSQWTYTGNPSNSLQKR